MRPASSASTTSWLVADEINNRLDARFNSADRVASIRHLREQSIPHVFLGKLANVSAMIGWKGLTTEHYTIEGPCLIRGVDFEDGILDFAKLVRVDRGKYYEQPQIHLRPGDVVMTKDGTIGKACAIPQTSELLAAGSTVARIRPTKRINSFYLEAVLNHEVVQAQVRGMATGLAQPHITQEWIGQLLVPELPQAEAIGGLVQQHHSAISRATQLTRTAIADVESLIDGKLDEAACLEQGRKLAQEFGFEIP
jgi:type I restriction enzyme S subunit